MSYTHIALCLCFVFLRLVHSMLPVSMNCPFWIVASLFSNVYLHLSGKTTNQDMRKQYLTVLYIQFWSDMFYIFL